MRTSTPLTVLSLGALAAAQDIGLTVLSAQVVVQYYQSVPLAEPTNTTINVFLSSTPQTNAALSKVSNLYLTGAAGAPVESVTCTPYRYANGTGAAGEPFSLNKPSRLSTNTVSVGSLVCLSSASGITTSSSSSSSMSTMTTSPITTSASGTISPPPGSNSTITTGMPSSTVQIITTTDSAGNVVPSTVTTVVPGTGTSTNTPTTRTSTQPSLNTGAAAHVGLGWSVMGLAAAGAMAAGL